MVRGRRSPASATGWWQSRSRIVGCRGDARTRSATSTRTVDRLHWLEVGVGISLLVAATGVGLWLVRIGLKPLSDMAATADAIAGGELDRRVEVRGGGEVEHLANALEQRLRRAAGVGDKLRRFVTDASHELRTPLTSIRGLLGVAAPRRALPIPNKERGRWHVSRTKRRGWVVLVDDLLLLARLDQGRPLERSPVDISRHRRRTP